jgi:hypothetical protein
MPTSSPSANKILVDLAIARESARVAAQSDIDARLHTRRLREVVAEVLSDIDLTGSGLSFQERAVLIVAAVERAGSAGPER